mmetsp:Transcript_40183/g.107747  ORF Transcript_40183/g.107747 Transcript_40183/m.107747 type:complete len:138 (+) Transcript_40183:222-635(+)
MIESLSDFSFAIEMEDGCHAIHFVDPAPETWECCEPEILTSASSPTTSDAGWDSGHLFRSSILTKDFQAASGNRTQSPADHDGRKEAFCCTTSKGSDVPSAVKRLAASQAQTHRPNNFAVSDHLRMAGRTPHASILQ